MGCTEARGCLPDLALWQATQSRHQAAISAFILGKNIPGRKEPFRSPNPGVSDTMDSLEDLPPILLWD